MSTPIHDDNFDLRSVSVRLDGRASIEHQIDIHVLDLVECVHNTDISLADILAGLKYVMDYRIKGNKMPNLDKDIMDRLAVGLLQNMSHKTGNLISQRFTEDATLSFILFGEFLQEVAEFREAIKDQSLSNLQFALKLHKRGTSPEMKEMVVTVLAVLIANCPWIADWKELVKEEEWDIIQDWINEFPDKWKDPSLKHDRMPFPPQCIFIISTIYTHCIH